MNHWMWPVSLVGILSTAVVYGTDMFFLTIGRPANMLIIGCDYHPSLQQIAWDDTESGECGEQRLAHSGGEAERLCLVKMSST